MAHYNRTLSINTMHTPTGAFQDNVLVSPALLSVERDHFEVLAHPVAGGGGGGRGWRRQRRRQAGIEQERSVGAVGEMSDRSRLSDVCGYQACARSVAGKAAVVVVLW
jgi:hypothetical protein